MAAPSILLPITVTGQQLGSDRSRWPRVLQTPSLPRGPREHRGQTRSPNIPAGLDPLPAPPAAPPSAPTSPGSPDGLCPRGFIPRLVLVPHTLRGLLFAHASLRAPGKEQGDETGDGAAPPGVSPPPAPPLGPAGCGRSP